MAATTCLSSFWGRSRSKKSFVDAFLHGEDRHGRSNRGTVPAVSLPLRKGNPGYNDIAAEAASFSRRAESEWPIARRRYTKLYLGPDHQLLFERPAVKTAKLSYPALDCSSTAGYSVTFSTAPPDSVLEITGHIVLHLRVSVAGVPQNPCPSDIDMFIALRHFTEDDEQVFYTGTTGQR